MSAKKTNVVALATWSGVDRYRVQKNVQYVRPYPSSASALRNGIWL
eukprot:COSAG03_NODE_9_length_23924_cov_40.675690_12_plen_46_part_00